MRLSMGRLLDTLLSNMDASARSSSSSQQVSAAAARTSSGSGSSCGVSGSGGGSGQRRLMLYSGHDSTVMPLLTGMRVSVFCMLGRCVEGLQKAGRHSVACWDEAGVSVRRRGSPR